MALTSMISRRSFIQSAAAGGAAALALQGRGASGITPVLSPFDYSQVRLLDGPLKEQFDQNHTFFLKLSEDKLLKIFRKRAGLPAPGEWMSVWYDEFCPGAHYGQYVSALARFYAATGSIETKEKVGRLVRGYAATLDPSGKIFADLRYPGYTYDKLLLMLIDANSYTGETDAVEILKATTRAAKPHMAEKALTPQEARERPHKDGTYLSDETYTMAENLFLAYERLGDPEYFEMGRRYLLDKTFFDPLAAGDDPLPTLHAYSHMNALSSGVQGYLKLGDAKYFRAVSNAVDLIWKYQSYATGGWGPNEQFVQPGTGALGKSLTTTRSSFETPCGAYAHFKLMRYMTAITKDSRYGDSLEKVLYNTILGATRIEEDGKSFYYSDYHDSGFKAHNRVFPNAEGAWDRDGKWPCCSGTLPQIVSDYAISAYFNAPDGVYVNLYVPSRLSWTRDGAKCTLTQSTSYPIDNLVTLDFAVSAPRTFTVYLRVPAWAGPQTSISLNGKRMKATPTAGTFHAIRRSWKSGDKLEFEIDQPIRTEQVDAQTPERVAVLRGSQVMFALASEPPQISNKALQIARRGNEFSYAQGNNSIPLRPFWQIKDEIYQTYWKVRA
jgi:DUF1680 family protein